MKILTLPIVLTATVAFSTTALEVTTEPTNRSAVLEEYTGIACGNCPDGHRIAAELLQSAPEEMFVVSIHAGAFAQAGIGNPNYIIEKGQQLHDHFGISSYPCGMISRCDVGNNLIQNRGDWGESAKIVSRGLSPVNLAMESEWDNAKRNLTVRIKGYLVESVYEPRLTVMILQNNILGPQSGGLLGNDYPHRHMLRAMMNEDYLGDEIDVTDAGNYFDKEYTMTIPESFNGVPFVPYDMELLAFVTVGDGEIVKAVESYPEIPADDSTRMIVVPGKPLIPIGNTYALDYIEMYLMNYTAEPVVSAGFDVTMNNETRELAWHGDIPAHSGQTVRVPLNGWWKNCYNSDTNNYKILMKSANDRPQVLEVSAVSGRFKDLPIYPTELKIRIRTDLDAAENRYLLLDEDGNVVKEFGPYDDNDNRDYEETVTLEDNKVYGLEVSDKWGNGVFHPRGYLRIYDKNDGIRGQMQEIDDYGMRMFFRTSVDADDSGVESVAPGNTVVASDFYDINGCKVDDNYIGVRIIRTVMSDGSVRIDKVIVK